MTIKQWRHKGGGGPTRVTPSKGVTPDLKLIFVAEFKKNTGKTTREDGSGEETTSKKGHHFQRR